MILSLFLVLFVGLKLSGIVDWSWFIVLLPGMLLILRFLFIVTLKVGVEQKQDWAVNFVKWIKS